MGETVERLKKVANLGGKIKLNKDTKWAYFGNTGNMSKEKLFGKIAEGPLHPGMPYNKKEMAVSSIESDTRADLVKELMEKGLTREEAVYTIKDLLKEGTLIEKLDPDLGEKVLVFRGG